MIWIVVGLMIALTVVYMLRPRFKAFIISAASFFEQTAVEKPPRVVLRVDAALLSRSFWVQVLALACLLLALLFSQHGIEQPESETVGVWFVVDTSASMSTRASEGTRMDATSAEINAVLESLAALPDEVAVCTSLTVFDLNLTTPLPNATPEAIRNAAASLTHRPLGTDLTLPRRLLAQLTSRNDLDCPLTHLVIISDATAPGWVTEPLDDTVVLWRVVGQPIDNIGITNIVHSGGGVLGWQGDIRVELAAYGTVPRQSILTIRRETDGISQTKTVDWFQNRETATFTLTGAGTYTIELAEGGAYSYDDSAMIVVGDTEQRRVDWQLPDSTIPALLGWVQDSATPEIRVLSIDNPLIDGQTPTLLVGTQYQRSADPRDIGYFEEGNPLLENLNLDVAEALGIAGVNPFGAELGVRYALVERDSNAVWVATNETPRFAYIPGLPLNTGEENFDAFTQTLFYNAVRWLFQTRELPALYTLTSPTQPTLEGTRIALHPGEGDTYQAAASVGDLDTLVPLVSGMRENPVWVWFVFAAALLVLLEHLLAVFGGRKWGT